MQSAPLPPNESQRLKELYSDEVLDTATDKALNGIVQAAATICGTTFGAISLVDLDRQWFKAQFGFSLKETVRSDSICGHGILQRTFFEVPDTVTDQGSGVPQDFQARLFERFAQANTKTIRPLGGSGLGLSIVKSMTEAMGGAVACKSQLGCTEFSVELPQAAQVFP